MFDREYENPMVVGDYGELDAPNHTVTCTSCGRVWDGYDIDDTTEWDCTDDTYESSFKYPVVGNRCRVCTFENRTKEQETAYIAAKELESDVIEYLLNNKSDGWYMNHNEVARKVFDFLINQDDETIRSGMDDLIHSFIADESKSEFIDWVMWERTEDKTND